MTLIEGYSDSSFAPRGGKSQGAMIVTVAGMIVFWKTKKQPFVTLSTAESELLEATQVLTATRSVEVLLKEILRQEVRIIIKVDNAAAVSIANPVSTFHWRTRHLKVRAAAMIEAIENKEIEVQRIPGKHQLADIGTKTLPKTILYSLMYQLNMIDGKEVEEFVRRLRRSEAFKSKMSILKLDQSV